MKKRKKERKRKRKRKIDELKKWILMKNRLKLSKKNSTRLIKCVGERKSEYLSELKKETVIE